MWKKVIHALWKSFQTDFGNLIGQLQKHQHLIETQASIHHFETSWATRELVKEQFEITKRMEKDLQLRRVREWLASTNAEQDQKDHSRVRAGQSESGKWILQTSQFRDWADPDFCQHPLLWINGMPGAGEQSALRCGKVQTED